MLTKRADMNGKYLLPNKEITSITNAMDMFLESIPLEKRVIFMRRYWFCDTYAEIASRYGISERKVRRQIQGIRDYMCDYLGRSLGSFGINHVDAKFIREAEEVISLKDEKMYLDQSILIDFLNFVISIFMRIPKHV